MSISESILSVLDSVRGVRDGLAEKDRKIESIAQVVEAEEAKPAHPTDVVRRAKLIVGQRAARHRKRFAQQIVPVLSKNPADPSDDRITALMMGRIFLAPAEREDQAASILEIEDALCAVFEDQVKAAVERAIMDLPHAGHGAPAAERAKVIVKHRGELKKLRDERMEIVDALAALRREGEPE